VPVAQTASPARLVASTLYSTLAGSVTDYTYVDFCAGAGGPTPYIERDLNAKLMSPGPELQVVPNGRAPKFPLARTQPAAIKAVKFVLTDLHPHISDWTEAAKKSQNLGFISRPVDAANAPVDLINNDGGKVFRLFNLAFHHFEDDLARDILRNTLETSDGFGYVTFIEYMVNDR
jgi:hypothetical protein